MSLAIWARPRRVALLLPSDDDEKKKGNAKMAEAHSATLFVIDVGATMGEERNYNGKSVPKLTRAMEYVNFKLQNMVCYCFRTVRLGLRCRTD